MSYNRSKRIQKKADAPLMQEKALQDYNKDWGHSLPESIPNYNGLLGENRGEGTSNPDQTVEALMDKARKEANNPDGRTTEGQLDKRKSYQVHRDADHYDESPMMPINALAGSYDSKFHKDYAKAAKGEAREYLDKDPGSQMDGPVTKVPTNMPLEGSQLNNQPSRFKGAQSERSLAILASLQDSDQILFNIYFKAASENRELNSKEQSVVAQISSDKKKILAQVGRIDPRHPAPAPAQPARPAAPAAPPSGTAAPQPTAAPAVPPSDPAHPHGDVHSEFYPNQMPGAPNDGSIDDALISELLGEPAAPQNNGVTPRGGIGGEDLNNPDFANIHHQERQEIGIHDDEEEPRF